jgi:hypothetical protein
MTNPYANYQSKFTSGGGDGLFTQTPEGTVKLRIFSLAHYSLGEYTDPESGEKTHSDKYSWVVWNYDDDKAQILSKGKSVFNQIAELSQDEDWGDPTTYDIKITRTGKGMETRYSVVPSPSKGTLTEAQVEACEAIDLPKVVKGAIPIDQALIDADNGKSGVEEVFTK